MNIKPYRSSVPALEDEPVQDLNPTITSVDAAPTRNQIAQRMMAEIQSETDAHKRQVARAQLIKFLCEGQDIVARAAREKAALRKPSK